MPTDLGIIKSRGLSVFDINVVALRSWAPRWRRATTARANHDATAISLIYLNRTKVFEIAHNQIMWMTKPFAIWV